MYLTYYFHSNHFSAYGNDEFFDMDRQLIAFAQIVNAEDSMFRASIDNYVNKRPELKAVSVCLDEDVTKKYCDITKPYSDFLKEIESEKDIKFHMEYLDVLKESLVKRLRIKSDKATDIKQDALTLQAVIATVKPIKLAEENLV